MTIIEALNESKLEYLKSPLLSDKGYFFKDDVQSLKDLTIEKLL